MISIIIASVNPSYLSSIKQNIEDTIGTPYEIISVDNADANRGLCEIYNECANKARYEILCFMHEDLKILTPDWGLKVIDIMRNENIGLLGVAGATYKTLAPSGWGCPGIHKLSNKVNIIQHYKFDKQEARHDFFNADNDKLVRVACIDGVWMCTRKTIAQEMKFDENLLKYFHGYDIDFSLSVAAKYEVAVTYEVLMEHFSEGNFSINWLDSALSVNAKHLKMLPMNYGGFSKKQRITTEKLSFKLLLNMLSDQGYGILGKMGVFWKFQMYRVLGFKQTLLFQLNILIGRY